MWLFSIWKRGFGGWDPKIEFSLNDCSRVGLRIMGYIRREFFLSPFCKQKLDYLEIIHASSRLRRQEGKVVVSLVHISGKKNK